MVIAVVRPIGVRHSGQRQVLVRDYFKAEYRDTHQNEQPAKADKGSAKQVPVILNQQYHTDHKE
jgi:hypothetical protein